MGGYGLVRPGNAGSNTAADHVELLDQVIRGLPETWQVGHRFADRQPGDTTIVIRTDTAGYSAWLIEVCQARNLEFSIGHPVTQIVRHALVLVQDEHWTPARNSDGEPRSGAEVTELTHLVGDQLPAGVRMIARRERTHPGAQLSVFDDNTRPSPALTMIEASRPKSLSKATSMRAT